MLSGDGIPLADGLISALHCIRSDFLGVGISAIILWHISIDCIRSNFLGVGISIVLAAIWKIDCIRSNFLGVGIDSS